MKLLRFLLLTISLTTTLFARAYDFEVNGLYYSITSAADFTCALDKGPIDYTGALTIPDEVEYLGRKLKVTSIECELNKVSSIQFGKNITKIANECFRGNNLITSIVLPGALRNTGYSVFARCESLTTVKWEGDMILSSSIFSGCTKLKNLSYKSICKKIPEYAFSNCSSLSLDLTEVQEIRKGAFYGCKSLNNINLSNIERIDSCAFYNCGNISLFIIGSTISEINNFICKNCVIDSLVISDSSTPLEIYRYANIRLREWHSGPNGTQITYRRETEGDIYGACNDGIVTRPYFWDVPIRGLYLGRNTVVHNRHRIEHYEYSTRFMYYTNPFIENSLETVKIGPFVTNLSTANDKYKGGGGYFERNTKLKHVVFENNNIEIGDNCFKNTQINEIVFPTERNIFGKEILPECITSVSFGKDVKFNGNLFSQNDVSLKQMSFLSAIPPVYDYKFSNEVYTSTKLLVPCGSRSVYQNTEPWNNFWNIEELPKVNADRVEIRGENKIINVGDTIRLTGLIYPGYALDTIQWKSSNEEIASISYNGLVTAVSSGKTTIIAICGKATAKCEINVHAIKADKITLSKEKVSLNQSDTIKISASVTPKKGTDKVKWSSSDLKVATVSEEGVVTAIGAGTAKITASCGDVTATCEVTVYEDTSFNIDFTDDKLNVAIEGADKLVSINIFSVFGECIYKKLIENSVIVKEEIDLSKLYDGTYIIHVISGEKNISKRIVKSNKE